MSFNNFPLQFLDPPKVLEINDNEIQLTTRLDREEKSSVKAMLECKILIGMTCLCQSSAGKWLLFIFIGNETFVGNKSHKIIDHFRKHIQINIDDLNDNSPFLAEDRFILGVIGDNKEVRLMMILWKT